MKEVYLDNAATTKMDPEVLEAMLPYMKELYGNPSSMHKKGMEAKRAISQSRKKVAEIINCDPEDIIFTGSGTESDNLAIFGYCRANKEKGNHIITTKIEHHAVLDAFDRLEKEGFKITKLDVDDQGILDPDEFEKSITDKTIFASIIYANNEIGSVQDIKEIAEICKKKKIALHTDACQATNYLEIDTQSLDLDLMTLNGSKIYGPKGVGILYKKKGIQIEPILYGGGQEFKLRSSTENVPAIVGFAKALELAVQEKDHESEKLIELRDYMIKELLKIDNTKLNGHPRNRLPNNVNISFLNIEGESLLLLLNEDGIFASTGSACSSDSLEPSHVIVALGLPYELGHSSIRFSLGKETTKDDIDYVIEKMKIHVDKLRKMSPLNDTMEEIMKKVNKNE